MAFPEHLIEPIPLALNVSVIVSPVLLNSGFKKLEDESIEAMVVESMISAGADWIDTSLRSYLSM